MNMSTITKNAIITVKTSIKAPVERVWNCWIIPKHIIRWNHASNNWFTPWAENNVYVEGKFNTRMEARDGSAGFNFEGTYKRVILLKQLDYEMTDGRNVSVTFAMKGKETIVTEKFEAENTNSLELQLQGWQAILNNFKDYVESTDKELVNFEIKIAADASKVYQTMFDKKLWHAWTAFFNPTSYFKGNWKKGSKMLFLGNDQNGKIGGMESVIRENIENKFVSIEHLNEYAEGKDNINQKSEWSGSLENYSFSEKDDYTLLKVDMDIVPSFKSYFLDTWPQALLKLKELCEN